MKTAKAGYTSSTTPDSQIDVTNGHTIHQWSMQKKLLVGSGVVSFLALSAIAAARAYTHYQNEKIESINCDRGFQYYKDAANKNGASASDQYCLAEMFETGNEIQQSLSKARKWYKEAYDQGLTLAKEALCVPHMFEHKWETEEEYEKFKDIFREYTAQFRNICCPPLPKWPWPVTNCRPPTCPWHEDFTLNQCGG